MNSFGDFKLGIRFEVGFGTKIRFRKDSRCSSRPFKLESPSSYHRARDEEAKVVDCWVPIGEGGVWNVDLQRRLND